MTPRTSKEKIRQALMWLMANQSFYGLLVSTMSIQPKKGVGTMCTDCVANIWYDDEFVQGMSPRQLAAVLAHEVKHKIHRHASLPSDKATRSQWNVAMDFYINGQLANEQHGSGKPLSIRDVGTATTLAEWNEHVLHPERELIPAGAVCLLDPSLDGKSEPEIYALLATPPQNPQQQASSDGDGGGDGSEGDDSQPGQRGTTGDIDFDAAEQAGRELAKKQGVDPADWEKVVADELTKQMAQAAMAAKSRGHLPSDMESLLDEMLTPTVNWQRLLRDFLTRPARSGMSFNRANRRAKGWPARYSRGAGAFVVAIDTSGSVSDEDVAQYLGEINKIMHDLTPREVHIIQCDTRVRHADQFSAGQTLDGRPVKRHGYGGTEWYPVFDYVQDNRLDVDAMVFFTDGYCPLPEQPHYPVLWGVRNGIDADHFTWGQYVPVD